MEMDYQTNDDLDAQSWEERKGELLSPEDLTMLMCIIDYEWNKGNPNHPSVSEEQERYRLLFDTRGKVKVLSEQIVRWHELFPRIEFYMTMHQAYKAAQEFLMIGEYRGHKVVSRQEPWCTGATVAATEPSRGPPTPRRDPEEGSITPYSNSLHSGDEAETCEEEVIPEDPGEEYDARLHERRRMASDVVGPMEPDPLTMHLVSDVVVEADRKNARSIFIRAVEATRDMKKQLFGDKDPTTCMRAGMGVPMKALTIIGKVVERMTTLRAQASPSQDNVSRDYVPDTETGMEMREREMLNRDEDYESEDHPSHSKMADFYRAFDPNDKMYPNKVQGPNFGTGTRLQANEENLIPAMQRKEIMNERACFGLCYNLPHNQTQWRPIWLAAPSDDMRRKYACIDARSYKFNGPNRSPRTRMTNAGILVPPPADARVVVSSFVTAGCDQFVAPEEIEDGYLSPQLKMAIGWERSISAEESWSRLRPLMVRMKDFVIMMRHEFPKLHCGARYNYTMQQRFNLPDDSRLWKISHYSEGKQIKKIVVPVDCSGNYVIEDLTELARGILVLPRDEERCQRKRSPTLGEVWMCFRFDNSTRLLRDHPGLTNQQRESIGKPPGKDFEWFYKTRTLQMYNNIYHGDDCMICEPVGIMISMSSSIRYIDPRLHTILPYESEKQPGGFLFDQRRDSLHPNQWSADDEVPQPLGCNRSKARCFDLMNEREWATAMDIHISPKVGDRFL